MRTKVTKAEIEEIVELNKRFTLPTKLTDIQIKLWERHMALIKLLYSFRERSDNFSLVTLRDVYGLQICSCDNHLIKASIVKENTFSPFSNIEVEIVDFDLFYGDVKADEELFVHFLTNRLKFGYFRDNVSKESNERIILMKYCKLIRDLFIFTYLSASKHSLDFILIDKNLHLATLNLLKGNSQ